MFITCCLILQCSAHLHLISSLLLSHRTIRKPSRRSSTCWPWRYSPNGLNNASRNAGSFMSCVLMMHSRSEAAKLRIEVSLTVPKGIFHCYRPDITYACWFAPHGGQSKAPCRHQTCQLTDLLCRHDLMEFFVHIAVRLCIRDAYTIFPENCVGCKASSSSCFLLWSHNRRVICVPALKGGILMSYWWSGSGSKSHQQDTNLFFTQTPL